MLKRKLLTLFFSALFSISLITIWALGDEPISNFIQMAYFISFIAIPFLVLFGFPVSVLADKLTEGLLFRKRMVISFIIHLVFGGSFIIFYGLLFY